LKSFFSLLTLIILLLLSSCQDEIGSTTIVSIQNQNKFLTSDLNHNRELVLRGTKIGSWEHFKIIKASSEYFHLLNTNGFYVSWDTVLNELSAIDTICSKAELFTFSPLNSSSLTIIRNHNNLPVIAKKNGKLTLGKPTEQPIVLNIQEISKPVNYFSSTQLFFLITGFLTLVISLYFFEFSNISNKTLISVTLLLLSTILIRVFAILLDEHLNTWDELFHALVAKNLINHPLTPTLVDNPILSYNYKMWIGNHIWLHKQPLFLWQMAAFMKVFGVNIIALRLHLVIMSTIITGLTYRIGSILVSRKTGFYAAIFFISSNFAIEQAAGYYHTDHNDVTFLFYITLSIWSWLEFTLADSNKKKMLFTILIGIFSGGAILTKWLVGLVVYLIWGGAILTDSNTRKKMHSYIYITIALTVTTVVALPWQLYILAQFPLESKWEYKLNSDHFFSAIENHSGDWMYHFSNSNLLYGIPFLLVLASIISLLYKLKHSQFKIGILTFILSIYLFFTLAATKMPAFVFIVSPIVFIAFATLINRFFNLFILNEKLVSSKTYTKLYHSIVILSLSVFFINVEKIQLTHTSWQKKPGDFWYVDNEDHKLAIELNNLIPDINQYVIFNMDNYKNIKAMFHSDAVAVYAHLPSQQDLIIVRNKGFKAAVYDDGNLPPEIASNNDILKFKKPNSISKSLFQN
jgi:4-amino-4-deoxy-L-arabinose transferase